MGTIFHSRTKTEKRVERIAQLRQRMGGHTEKADFFSGALAIAGKNRGHVSDRCKPNRLTSASPSSTVPFRVFLPFSLSRCQEREENKESIDIYLSI